MSKYVKYKGKLYVLADAREDYLEKLKDLLEMWKKVEKRHFDNIEFARQSLESAIKNPDKYDLRAEYQDRLKNLNSMRGR